MKEKYPLLEIVDKTGSLVSKKYEKEITEEQVKQFYYNMVRLRTYDKKGKHYNVRDESAPMSHLKDRKHLRLGVHWH